MTTDLVEDRFQVIGAPDTTADVVSNTGAGTPTVPGATERGTLFPLGGVEAVPAPLLGGFSSGFDEGYA